VPSQHVVTWDDETPKSVSIVCGYCRTAVEANRISKAVEVERWDEPPGFGAFGIVVGATYLCPRPECRGPSLVFMRFRREMADTSSRGIVGQLPRGKALPMEGLPEDVESDRDEAWSCFYGDDVRAAVIMGRAAIQRAVRTLNAEGKGLKAEIADLFSKGVITRLLKEWADEVRIAGDEAAHPDMLGKLEREEAEASMEFMDAFLNHALALPAKRDALKAARKGRGSS